MRTWFSFAVGVVGLFTISAASAAPVALIAASDPASLSELELVHVAASPSPLWLRARAAARTKLVLVSGANETEVAPDAGTWLAALDFATRVRVTPPPGPLAACSDVTGNLADSGAPDPVSIEPTSIATLGSELELRRELANAGLAASASEIAAFTAAVTAPYRAVFFESAEKMADTAAVRLALTGPALSVPGIEVASRSKVPATVLTLAANGLEPATLPSFEPSEFAVSYSEATASTNYTSARAAWSEEDPSRWLVEARGSSALFDFTVVAGVGQIEPGVSDYFERALGMSSGRACFDSLLRARANNSHAGDDFACGGADDLEVAEKALDFADLRVTRLFGFVSTAALALRVSAAAARDSHVVATDLDSVNCPNTTASGASSSSGAFSPHHGGNGSSEGSGEVVSGSDSGTSVDSSTDEAWATSNEDSCGVTVYPESCSGDSSTSSATGSDDSCSGDSSSSDGNNDSCSGDSSGSDSGSSDSCSGDSSSSSNDDSSGCGSSGYQGDSCSGSTENSANVDKSSAALEASGPQAKARRPKKLRLSLLTVFAAALGFPLRRRAAKFSANPGN